MSFSFAYFLVTDFQDLMLNFIDVDMRLNQVIPSLESSFT